MTDHERPSDAAAEEPSGVPPSPGMVISVLSREDVVVMDPQRFLAAARRAYLAENPDLAQDDAAVAIADVYDAVDALRQRYGTLASDHPDVAAGATPRRRMHGGLGLLPGDRVHDRPDGLTPGGSVSLIITDEKHPLQDYGCALPDDVFTTLARRATAD